MQIGVFDSGKGGELVASGLRQLLPDHTYHVINDTVNVPYGSRTNDEIISLTDTALQPLLDHCPIIVIACNTATMAAIGWLRERYPQTLFVGTEPMIKPASALSHTKHITVLATPLTLKSQRYQLLKEQFAEGLMIDEPNAHHWARDIETGQLDAINLEPVELSIDNGSDVVVLACTHYLALRSRLMEQFPHVTILEPTRAIAEQVARLSVQVQ